TRTAYRQDFLGSLGLRNSAADDLAGLDARGADLQALAVAATGGDPPRLDVGVPAPLGPPVRVGHVVAEAGPLATDVTHASHGDTPEILNPRTGAPRTHPPTGNPTTVPDGTAEGPIGPGVPRELSALPSKV